MKQCTKCHTLKCENDYEPRRNVCKTCRYADQYKRSDKAKKFYRQTAETMQLVTDWTTIATVAEKRGCSVVSARQVLQRLATSGHAEYRQVPHPDQKTNRNGGMVYEYRLTKAGKERLSSVDVSLLPDVRNPLGKGEAVASGERTGNNPFDWRNFKTQINWNDNNRYVPTEMSSKHYRSYQI